MIGLNWEHREKSMMLRLCKCVRFVVLLLTHGVALVRCRVPAFFRWSKMFPTVVRYRNRTCAPQFRVFTPMQKITIRNGNLFGQFRLSLHSAQQSRQPECFHSTFSPFIFHVKWWNDNIIVWYAFYLPISALFAFSICRKPIRRNTHTPTGFRKYFRQFRNLLFVLVFLSVHFPMNESNLIKKNWIYWLVFNLISR